MNWKGIIGSLVVVGLLVGCGVGWWAWGKWTSVESRGVSLQLKVAPDPEKRDELLDLYNGLLDDADVLQPIVQELALMGFYGVQSERDAIAMLRDRSKIEFSPNDERTLWILHRAQRREREDSDRIGRMLGDEFVKYAFPNSTSSSEQ